MAVKCEIFLVDKTEMATLPKIIAVDFDGTLVVDEYPNIGPKNSKIFDLVHNFQLRGYKVILWTCRDGHYLDQAVDFCAMEGLEFDAVNENIPEVQRMFNRDTRKVYADIYLDDKNMNVPLLLALPMVSRR